MTEQEFYSIEHIKHPADLDIGHIILLDTKHPLSGDPDTEYEYGYCFGCCGDEKFIRLDSGKECTVVYKTHRYIIIGVYHVIQ